MNDFLMVMALGMVLFFALVLLGGLVVFGLLHVRLKELKEAFDTHRINSSRRIVELEKQVRRMGAHDEAHALPAPAEQQTVAQAPKPAPPVRQTDAPQPRVETIDATQQAMEQVRRPTVSTPVAASPMREPVAPKPAQPRHEAPDSSAEAGRPRSSVEANLGGKMFVWIGAAAVALAGVFLVKYSFDNNLLSPTVRLALGTLLGLLLLVGGEFMRTRSRGIAQASTGAGIVDLYACILAAVNLYELLTPTAGFIAMIVVTALAVVLSLRHGQGVALLGLLGGFIMPVLLGGRFDSAAPILIYLFLLQAALVFLARGKGWGLVLILSALAGGLWAMVMAFVVDTAANRFLLQVFILMTFALFLTGLWTAITAAADASASAEGKARPGRAWSLTSLLGEGGMLLLVVLIFRGQYGATDLLMLGVMASALLVLARINPIHQGLFRFAGILCTLLLGFMALVDLEHTPSLFPTWERALWGFGALFALGSYLALWGSRREAYWAASCCASGLLLTLLGLMGYEQTHGQVVMGIEGLAMWKLIAPLGGLYVLAAIPLWMKRSRSGQMESALEVFALTSFILFALWAWHAFDHHHHLLAWAGLILLAVVVSRVLGLAGLTGFALVMGWLMLWLMTMIVAFRMEYGPRPVFNAIGLLYGGSALLIGLASWWMNDAKLRSAGLQLRFIALALASLGVFWLIRHAHDPADILGPMDDLLEWAWVIVAGLSIMQGLLVWDRLSPNWPSLGLACGLLGASLLACAGVLGLGLNPLWSHQPVGDLPVLNWLLIIYGLPAVLLVMLRWTGSHRPRLMMPAVGGVAALTLVFVLLTLQVRQYFQGTHLDAPGRTMAEMYSYSVAWIVLGVTLLVLGVKLGSRSLRYASLVVMLLAIGKVFLVDTSELQNLYRVLSLLGLGLSLMGLGYVYQRFVFRKPESVAVTEKEPSPAPASEE